MRGRQNQTTWNSVGVVSIVLGMLLATDPASAFAQLPLAPEATEEASTRVWIGPSGDPLPFTKNLEIEEFLRTAAIVRIEDIPVGVTHPRKVWLEKEGVQVKACFRDVDIFQQQVVLPSRGVRKNWRDCCRFEVAAYELSKLLGLSNIPPVVMRTIKGTEGTLQIWIENATMETDRAKRNISPPNPWRHKMQWQVMRVFDALIYNDDRNAGNILYDAGWKVWMIDHTRSFSRISDLPKPNQIRHCEKRLWERLQELDKEKVKDTIGAYVKSDELKALLKRHDKLVAYIQERITERGERQVLFSFYQDID